MGVQPADCRIVARMVGIKTFINEFIAYEDLGRVKANRNMYMSLTSSPGQNVSKWMIDGSSNWVNKQANVTLIGGVVSVRTVQQIILTGSINRQTLHS